MNVAVIDYGMGNLHSVLRAFEHLGVPASLTDDHALLLRAELLVLPGVGAFGDGMAELNRRRLIPLLQRHVSQGKPLVGICLGMQMLFETSEEFGEHKGLGLLPGGVTAIPERRQDGSRRRVPHVGWEEIVPPTEKSWRHTPLAPLAPGTAMYFVHSFAAQPADPAHILAVCEHDGHPICAAVQRDNVIGFQFHPEKSGPAGLAILRALLSP